MTVEVREGNFVSGECAICGMPIWNIDRWHQRVARSKGAEVHTYCQVVPLGIVPECPLYESLDPKPCSNECVQARACPPERGCDCTCDNVFCQIGQSVRALREKGVIPWKGYTPNVPKMPKPGQPCYTPITQGGIYIG